MRCKLTPGGLELAPACSGCCGRPQGPSWLVLPPGRGLRGSAAHTQAHPSCLTPSDHAVPGSKEHSLGVLRRTKETGDPPWRQVGAQRGVRGGECATLGPVGSTGPCHKLSHQGVGACVSGSLSVRLRMALQSTGPGGNLLVAPVVLSHQPPCHLFPRSHPQTGVAWGSTALSWDIQ